MLMTDSKKASSDPTYLLEEGTTINDKWKILSFIAKGGKGEVYLAYQLNLNRQVALKIMSQEFIKSLEGDEEEIASEIKRFRREVQVMARMQHPNILQVYDFDQLEMDGIEMDYIVMEYIPGPTLRQKMPKEGFGQNENKVKNWLKKYFFPILQGMKAVHNNGVVHRDMKPENVLIEDERPKIMDFGIAGGHHFSNVTQTHHMIGTLQYMPEEQFVELALTDARVDVYALGKILYEAVEGKMKKGRDKPFKSVAITDPETPFFKVLDRIIQQATAKNRNQRTPSVKSLHDSLDELVVESEEKINSRKSLSNKYWKVLFGFSGVLIIILAGTWLIHESPNLPLMSDENHTPRQEEISKAEGISLALPIFNFKKRRPTLIPSFDKAKGLPAIISATDNMTMILLKEANIFLPVEAPGAIEGDPIKKSKLVKTFYMDKTKVTNHLYVQFLHELDGVVVKKDSVIWNGQILLMLGKVAEGYEPITFKDDVLRANPDTAANPVVRVTPSGALAYAQYYGRSLPLMVQWWRAVQAGEHQTTRETTAISLQPERLTLETGIQSVTTTLANPSGIHGLRQNVHEWTYILSSDDTPQFYIHGKDNRESYVERQPWEAFSNVGFRTVLNLSENQ